MEQRTRKKKVVQPPVLDPEVLRHAELVTVEQLHALEPALPASRIRAHLFHRHTNGLVASGAVVQDGRKIMLRPRQYLAWLTAPETQRRSIHRETAQQAAA